MKKYLLLALLAFAGVMNVMAQYSGKQEGEINDEIKWEFDGKTLAFSNISKPIRKVNIPEYDLNNVAPWIKKKLPIKGVKIGRGIERIGSCAFANCTSLTEVEFEGANVKEIGWGAFMSCKKLRTFSLPATIRKVETIAFADCISLPSIKIPDHCAVEDQAFINTEAKDIEIAPTATIGHYVFASETKVGGKPRHALYNGEIRRLPVYINVGTSNIYGISKETVSRYYAGNSASRTNEDYDYKTSELDSVSVVASDYNMFSYALIIGNQNYRFEDPVTFAIHDARVFKDYCIKMLGIPADNINIIEDGTKAMINEEAFQWLEDINNRSGKKLIIYYAGHGVPDTRDSNKSYMLPVDIRGSKPQNGISLEDFYQRVGELDFAQTSVFLDACFSGMKRDDKSLSHDTRATRASAKAAAVSEGNMIVFSAAQGNETAQGYNEQGHGLFTYYLLSKINQVAGQGMAVTFGELSDYIYDKVKAKASQLQRPQTPATQATRNLSEDNKWRRLGF